LYKNLVEAPASSTDSTGKTKDYQQLKSSIDHILKENERLHAEIHDFKTSDPVYEQVQLLETANKHLKHELQQITQQNHRLKKLIDADEIKRIKAKLIKSQDECEKLKVLNKNLANELQKRQHQHQQSSNQVHFHFLLTLFRIKLLLTLIRSGFLNRTRLYRRVSSSFNLIG